MRRFFTSLFHRFISAIARFAKFGSYFVSVYLLYRLAEAVAPFVVPQWASGVENILKINLPDVAKVSSGDFGDKLGLFLLAIIAYVISTWQTYRVDTWLNRRRLDGFLVRDIRPKADAVDRKDEFVLAYTRPAERMGGLTSYVFQIIGTFFGLLIWHYYVEGPEAIAFFKSLLGQLNPAIATTEMFLGNQDMFISFAIGLVGLVLALWCFFGVTGREARAHSVHYYMTDRALVVVQSYLVGWIKSKNKLLPWKTKPWHPRKILYGHLRMPEPQTTFTEEFFWNRRTMTIPFDTDVALEGPEAILYHVKPEFFWLTDSNKREEFINSNPELKKG